MLFFLKCGLRKIKNTFDKKQVYLPGMLLFRVLFETSYSSDLRQEHVSIDGTNFSG